MDQPPKNVLQRLDAFGRLLKWAVELSQYDLTFKVQRAVKAQALVDFLAKNSNTTLEIATPPSSWNLYADDSSTEDGNGANQIIETLSASRNTL